jgi:3',5'-cyclic AMP phosphodiesterase CpdA
MRIFAVSDPHTDFAENSRRLERVSSTSYLQDVLIVAGDIADDLRIIDWTLRKLRSRFGQVFYVPGNHELWVRIFGHSHIDFDQVVEGVRYVQHAFDYPQEKAWSKDRLKQIW